MYRFYKSKKQNITINIRFLIYILLIKRPKWLRIYNNKSHTKFKLEYFLNKLLAYYMLTMTKKIFYLKYKTYIMFGKKSEKKTEKDSYQFKFYWKSLS